MNEDRRTKAQILAELEQVQLALSAAEAKIPAPLNPVPAAQALEGCIRALDLLPKKRTSNLYGNLDGGETDRGEIANVLRHLMSRYGVDLTVRSVEPCNRVHLEDAADEVLIDRLRGRF